MNIDMQYSHNLERIFDNIKISKEKTLKLKYSFQSPLMRVFNKSKSTLNIVDKETKAHSDNMEDDNADNNELKSKDISVNKNYSNQSWGVKKVAEVRDAVYKLEAVKELPKYLIKSYKNSMIEFNQNECKYYKKLL